MGGGTTPKATLKVKYLLVIIMSHVVGDYRKNVSTEALYIVGEKNMAAKMAFEGGGAKNIIWRENIDP